MLLSHSVFTLWSVRIYPPGGTDHTHCSPGPQLELPPAHHLHGLKAEVTFHFVLCHSDNISLSSVAFSHSTHTHTHTQ